MEVARHGPAVGCIGEREPGLHGKGTGRTQPSGFIQLCQEEAGDADLSTLPTPRAGLNRFAWNYRGEALPEVEGLVPFGSLQGRLVPPGTYQVRLTRGETSQTRTLEVRPDPRRDACRAKAARRQVPHGGVVA